MYFFQREVLTKNEASAILFTEQKIRTQAPNKIEYPLELNVKFIRIAHLYVKMYVLISRCLDICGLHEMTVSFKMNFLFIGGENVLSILTNECPLHFRI